MKWLKENPLGMVLVGAAGFLTLLALTMAIVWSLPVKVDVDDTGAGNAAGTDAILVADQMKALNEYRIINEKPVFNESRTPEIVEDDSALEEEVDPTIAVTGAPDVKLTGIIITPAMKIASLTPSDGAQESVMAHEGQSLTGEYVGWQVSTVNPRNVVLESRDGQKLALDLQVHDVKIKEPPKPVPAATPVQAHLDPAAAVADEDEPLSRAEQIRQRIAERREELRREQEEQERQAAAADSKPKQSGNSYQNAIRARIRNNPPKDEASNDKNDG